MASIEKLVKAFEALKVIQTPIDRPEEALVSTRFIKKETSLTKKDKILHCNTISDIICCPSLRNIEDFHKFLGITIETFLACCDDNDSDVRMVANECLNRTIKNLMDTQLGRIQVELYKEIKKNASSRSLRAALSRFADLCHLTRPAKCRPYVVNLFPCLVKISERTEEDSLQETLRIAMTKIMPVLAIFASDNEIINLLTAFLPNLQFIMASVRRTAASSMVIICHYSRKPHVFFSWLLSHLLSSFNRVKLISDLKDNFEQQSCDRVLVGIFLCLKHMIPYLYDIPSHIEYESLKTFGSNQKQSECIAKECEVITENLLQIYEISLFNLRYNSNHNVILSSLEALLQLMKTPPKLIMSYLLDKKGMGKSRIGSYIRSSTPASPSMLSMIRNNKRLNSNNSASCSSINMASMASLDDDEENICGVTTLDTKSNLFIEEIETHFQRPDSSSQPSSLSETFIDNQSLIETDNSGLEMTSIANEDSIVLDSEKQSFKSSNKYLSSNFQMTKLTYVEYDESVINDSQISPSASDSFDAIEESCDTNNGDIGEFTTLNIPSLEYCVRLICNQFLLNGNQSGLISDKSVRVSVKSLALGCIAAMVRLHPKSLIIDLYLELDNNAKTISDSPQKIWDILLYSSHSDPQLRGQVALIIGHFIHEILNQPNSYNDFLLQHCSLSAYSEAPSLDELLNNLVTIIMDKQSSSIATKHGLAGLKLCFINLLQCNDSINKTALLLIDKIIELKNNPYWLVKTELLEIFADIPYKVVYYLEIANEFHSQSEIIVKKERYQNKIIDSLFKPLIADEDYRVREAACVALVKMVSFMFTPMAQFDNDPITGIAFEHILFNFPENKINFQDKDNFIPFIKSFTDPISFKNSLPVGNCLLESNLLNIVNILAKGLIFNIENKSAFVGYCRALALLSETYSISYYPYSWGCDLNDNSTAIQLINIAITLLSNNAITVLDLNTHQNVIIVAINMMEGLAYHLIKSNIKSESLHNEFEWGIISSLSPYLASQLEALFIHLIKIINIYSCIIDESFSSLNLNASNNKIPVIQTISNSTLSPIRRKSIKQLSDGTDKMDSKSNKKVESEKSDKEKSGKFQFISNPIFLKLYEMLRSAYISGKTSMDLKGDKIASLLSVTLNALSRLLEMATIKYIGKYSEEILQYLKIVFSLEPCLAIKNVRQLLKCIFGTNYVVLFCNDNYEDDSKADNTEESQSFTSVSSISQNFKNSEMVGLYNCCLATPYTKFTQFFASKSSRLGSNYANVAECEVTFSSWLRKKIEKRVSFILDKNKPYGSANISQSSKSSLASHIRLFEPIVIKALKQYTVTSNITMQCEVLDLLSQLVQLRVNYCLLDSDQIFIGFVLKQFEFIEGGQFENFDKLISHIFFFLILLSYEKYHSKPIIGIPKIIQLCDGIIASGQHPEKFAIPSLQSIVEDLMLLRNASKVDSSKELETQREVIVSNCLKLAQFPQILNILLIIIKQNRREGEEKWKKMSRQIIDTLLPQLIKQSIHIDCYESLDILHSLFESVSQSVFRPVDILLKALFAAPHPDLTNNYYFFHRWISMILVILRVLIVQAKEEVVLARLEELKSSIITIGPFGLPVIPTTLNDANSIPFHMSSLTAINKSFTIQSEEMLASYLLQIIQLCFQEIEIRNNSIYKDIQKHCEFLIQQMANYIIILTHMFQSGLFRRVFKAAMNLIKANQFQENDDSSYLSGFSLNKTNSSILSIMSVCPTLSLQWFNLLMLLNYEDYSESGLWNKLIRPNNCCLSNGGSRSQSTEVRRSSGNKMKNMFDYSPSCQIIKRGSLILLCDFVCENMNDAEHMTWLIVQNINEIISMCFELPISEFISTIHRNSASSGLFIQAINSRCDENLNKPSFVRRLLSCLERVHSTQSSSLITFLIEKIITNEVLVGNHLLIQNAEEIAYKFLNLMIESFQREADQISEHDLDKLIACVSDKHHEKLNSKLKVLRNCINDSNNANIHPLLDNENIFKMPDINKDWFLLILQQYCMKCSKGQKAANLLNKLSYEDIISVLTSKDFALEILGECIEFCDQNLIDDGYKSNSKIMFSAVMNRINLLKASLNTVVQHLNYFVDLLPTPHYPFLAHQEMCTPKEARHRQKIIELFSDSFTWSYLFKLSSGFLAFLEHHSERSVSPELLANVTRISVLYSETAQFMTEIVRSASFVRLVIVLKIMKASITCSSIFTYLSDPQNISYQCSFISAIYSFAHHFFGDLPKLDDPEDFSKSEHENPELKHSHRSCVRMAQLIHFIENNEFNSFQMPPICISLIRKITLATARLPLVNSFVIIPFNMWNIKMANPWNPNFSGDFGTIISVIPSEYLHDREIFMQFWFRITHLGWTTRVQFEEIWMSLLGVFASTCNNDSAEEQTERISISIIAVKTITDLLLLSTLSPQGNPVKSKFVKQKKDKVQTFLHTRFGEKLQAIREPLLTAINSLIDCNSEFDNSYDFGQVSVELLRHAIKGSSNANELSPSISSTSSTSSSSSGYSPISPGTGNKIIESTSVREKTEIDLNSCLHFLLDLYGQLLSLQRQIQLPLLTEICRSILLLSDLFYERTQFDWMLDTFLELHRIAQIAEDEIISQYLIVGICKSAVVLGIESEALTDKCKKSVDICLRSPFLPTRIATLHALKYVLEFRGICSNGKEIIFLPLISDYIVKHLSDNSLPSSHNLEHVEQMWKLAFHIIENFVENFAESDFGQKIIQLGLKVITDKQSLVFVTVVNCLEHLLLSEKLTINESNFLVKSALERFKSSTCQLTALLSLNLITSSTYFVGSVGIGFDKNADENEEFFLAMEKLSVIFERLKNCLYFEAEQICNILPHFLSEFYPTQDILNKCIGEFLSGQQIHAKHLANILFLMFNKLQNESRLDIVHDWVILSLSSFTQLIPLSHAIWSLTVFLISASTNSWIRYTFPYAQTRFGLLDQTDRDLFCVVCINFYNELKTDENRLAFLSAYQLVADVNSPYSDVLRYLQLSKRYLNKTQS